MKIQALNSITQTYFNKQNDRKDSVNFQQARLISKPAKFIATSSILAATGIVANKINDQISKKDILLQRIKENPENIKNKLMQPSGDDGQTPMYLDELSKEDIISINEAFVEAGEVDKLAEIHQVKDSLQRYPIHSYFLEPELIFSTLNSLKTKPDTIEILAGYDNLWLRDHDRTVENLYKIKEIFKDSPDTLAVVLNSCGYTINKDTYLKYFDALNDVPDALAQLHADVYSERYDGPFGKQFTENYPQNVTYGIIQKYIDLAINSDLNEEKSIEILRRYEDEAAKANILPLAINRSFQQELSNKLKESYKNKQSNLFDKIISENK